MATTPQLPFFSYMAMVCIDPFEGLVYVVDSSDVRRLEESSRELRALLGEEKLAGIPTLVPLALDRWIRVDWIARVRPVDQVKRKQSYRDVFRPSPRKWEEEIFHGYNFWVWFCLCGCRGLCKQAGLLDLMSFREGFCFSRLFSISSCR